MTTDMALSIDTLKELRSDLRWWSCNIFSTHYYTVTVIAHAKYADVFSWKGERIEEYWDCILNDLIKTEGDSKGHRTDIIVDDWGNMTIIIHEGKEAEDFSLKYGTTT